jgi:hypothetical protein
MEDMVTNSVKDLLHKFFAVLAKCVVDVAACHEEHVGPDFKWHFLSDLGDGGLVFVNLSLEGFSLEWLFLQEGFNSFSFLQDEEVVIVYIQSKIDHFQVLTQGLRDQGFGIHHKLVVNLHIPKVHLVTSGDGVLWSWEVAAL